MAATLVIPAVAMPAVITNFIFTGLAFLIVGLRLCTRAFMVKNLGADDIFITCAMAAAIGFLAIFMLQIKAGLGRELTFPEVPGFLQAVWATIPLYNLSLVLCKLSITLQCYRVLRTDRMQRFFRIYFVILAIYGLWTVFSSIFTCWPIETYWTFMLPGAQGKCMDKTGLTFSNAAINIATDIILIAVPMPLLWRLQIPRRQKYVLMGLFCLGTFATVISIVRLHALHIMGISPPAEQSIKGVPIAMWSCIEITTAIICASVPAVKPLVVKFFPKLLLSEMYKRTNYYANRSGNKGTNGSTSDSGNRSRVAQGTASAAARASPAPAAALARPGEIKVHQSFEMTSAPASGVINRLDLDNSDDEKSRATGGGLRHAQTPSRDGSEKNLFASSWQQDEVYHHGAAHGGGRRQKKPSLTSHPREIV